MIAHKYKKYTTGIQKEEKVATLFNSLGIHRFCCKRMFLGHVDLSQNDIDVGLDINMLQKNGMDINKETSFERVESCD